MGAIQSALYALVYEKKRNLDSSPTPIDGLHVLSIGYGGWQATPRIIGVRKLLKGIETGDPQSITVIKEDQYIQDHHMTPEVSEGLAKGWCAI